MKRFIFLCLASISLLSSCDYAPFVKNPLTSHDKPSLGITVNDVTAIVTLGKYYYYHYDDGSGSVGVCWDTTPNPSLQSSSTKELTYDNEKQQYFGVLDNLQENTTYYLRLYISDPGSFVYGDEITFTTQSYVDLGLSVKWGTANVGTSAEYPYGQYFAWGEIDSKKVYNLDTYKWGTFDDDYTKYVTDSKYAYSTIDNKTVLDLEDDAAYVHLNHKAQIPTKEQWEELISSCDWKREEKNGMYGYRVTSKTNQNSIFLPALGYMSNQQLDDSGYLYYWSKSLNTTTNPCAWCFYGDNGVYYSSTKRTVYTYKIYNMRRPYGLPIRAVYEE